MRSRPTVRSPWGSTVHTRRSGIRRAWRTTESARRVFPERDGPQSSTCVPRSPPSRLSGNPLATELSPGQPGGWADDGEGETCPPRARRPAVEPVRPPLADEPIERQPDGYGVVAGPRHGPEDDEAGLP